MKELYHLKRKTPFSHECEALLFEGINDEAAHCKGMDPIHPFGICIENREQKILGGVKGATSYECLYVDMLWIDRNLRNQGWGTKLMQEAEKIGRERRCTFAILNTMDWEALPFYQKLGYAIEFIREGYEKDSKMFMLRKSLL